MRGRLLKGQRYGKSDGGSHFEYRRTAQTAFAQNSSCGKVTGNRLCGPGLCIPHASGNCRRLGGAPAVVRI
jgi:hypothetical protein